MAEQKLSCFQAERLSSPMCPFSQTLHPRFLCIPLGIPPGYWPSTKNEASTLSAMLHICSDYIQAE